MLLGKGCFKCGAAGKEILLMCLLEGKKNHRSLIETSKLLSVFIGRHDPLGKDSVLGARNLNIKLIKIALAQ